MYNFALPCSHLSAFFMTTDFLQNIPVKSGDQRTWGNLKGSGHAWALQQAARHHNGLLLVITRQPESV